MKITFPHPDLLQGKNDTRPALLALIVGSLITGLGIFATLNYAKVTKLDCDRTPPDTITCQWQEQGILQTRRELLIGLTAVEVEVDEEHVPPLYRLHLVMAQGERPFTANYTDNAAIIKCLGGQIDTFITESSQTQLAVKLDRRWFGYGFGGILSAIGLFCLDCALWRACVVLLRVDRRRGLISVEYRSLMRHCRTHHYLLQNVQAIAAHRSEWDGKEQISVLLNSGEFVALTLPDEADGGAIKKIQAFLQSA